MANKYTSNIDLPKHPLWKNYRKKRIIHSFDLELTARCNNNCKHCYINLPEKHSTKTQDEITLKEIKSIIDQAFTLGVLWCLITGGEPLIRKDFFDIYTYIKKKGLLVSVFTNACLITEEHIKLFTKLPPRDIEISVYGATKKTYEKVTQVRGSFKKFINGLNLLNKNQVKVRLKAMVIKSNLHEFEQIKQFCLKHTKDYFRYDPFLHLRYDQNVAKNQEIREERLDAKEIQKLEKQDKKRQSTIKKVCKKTNQKNSNHHLFVCGAGIKSFAISHNGFFKLCSSLVHEKCICDLKTTPLIEAINQHTIKVREKKSNDKNFIENCQQCNLFNLCLWCPANAYLETGKLDGFSNYFCEVAKKRI